VVRTGPGILKFFNFLLIETEFAAVAASLGPIN